MWEDDIVMTVLENLLASYEYFIIVLETMPMKELTMKHVIAHFMHKMSKHKQKEPKAKTRCWYRVKAKRMIYLRSKL